VHPKGSTPALETKDNHAKHLMQNVFRRRLTSVQNNTKQVAASFSSHTKSFFERRAARLVAKLQIALGPLKISTVLPVLLTLVRQSLHLLSCLHPLLPSEPVLELMQNHHMQIVIVVATFTLPPHLYSTGQQQASQINVVALGAGE
jgi:hypothetical protein